MVRAMLAVHSIFAATPQMDLFREKAQQLQSASDQLVKKINLYVDYNQNHLKTAKTLAQ